MFDDKIVISINGSSDGDTRLSALTLAEADAFITLISSLRDLCSNSPNNDELKIEVKEGSAQAILKGPPGSMASIYMDFDEVLNGKSSDYSDVNSWKNIQDVMLSEELALNAIFVHNGFTHDIKDNIINAKRFRRYGNRTRTYYKLEFFNGILTTIGGKMPNIHVKVEDRELVIDCSELVAQKVKEYLYKDFYIASWTKINAKHEVRERAYCQVYKDYSEFNKYRKFLTEYNHSNIDSFIDGMYDISNELLDGEDIRAFRRFMNLFIHGSWDLNVLKTMLVISYPFRDRKEIKNIRHKLTLIYRSNKTKLSNH